MSLFTLPQPFVVWWLPGSGGLQWLHFCRQWPDFTVTDDDCLTLIIDGINLGFSAAPTRLITSVAIYVGPSGNFSFDLVYAECCGGPAVLQVDLPFSNNQAPEPETLASIALGLSGMGWRVRGGRIA